MMKTPKPDELEMTTMDPAMPFGQWLENVLNRMDAAGGERAEMGIAVQTTEGIVPVVISVVMMTKERRDELARMVNADRGKGKH